MLLLDQQTSNEAGQVVWYSHLIKNFPQFVVIHTVKGFDIVNKTEIDDFLELPCFFNNRTDVATKDKKCWVARLRYRAPHYCTHYFYLPNFKLSETFTSNVITF